MTIILVLSLFLFSAYGQNASTPEQIHIALTDFEDEMSITWITPKDVKDAVVIFGTSPNQLTRQVLAYSTNQHYYFIPDYASGAIHYAILQGLTMDTVYYYQVGSQGGAFSETYSFATNRQLPIKVIVTGDIGDVAESHKIIDKMVQLDQTNHYDFLIHSGDLSYANGYQPTWDSWGKTIQPLANHLPYMVSVGNHETFSLWIAFLYRFNMPASESGATEGNLYYSFDYGPIHVIALSSEMPFFWHWLDQYQWLAKDLAKIDRQKTPWVFTTWHRPFYCSNTAHWQSNEDMRTSYEQLLYQYHVDISFTGHIHAYERTKPIYNYTVVPDGIVTLVVGNGGNGEGLYPNWRNPQPDWSVYRESHYGFGSMTIYNRTHLHWQMIRDDGSVADDWWFERNH